MCTHTDKSHKTMLSSTGKVSNKRCHFKREAILAYEQNVFQPFKILKITKTKFTIAVISVERGTEKQVLKGSFSI